MLFTPHWPGLDQVEVGNPPGLLCVTGFQGLVSSGLRAGLEVRWTGRLQLVFLSDITDAGGYLS